eukprot:g2126.t1
MKELDWRWLCIMGAVPSIFGFVLSYSFMKDGLQLAWARSPATWESPAYLLENGYVDEAKELLESYKRWNGAEHVCCDLVTTSAHGRTPRSARQNVEAIFSPALRLDHGELGGLHRCGRFGSLYAFPQVFSDMSASTPYSPAMALVVGAIYEIPGPMAGPLVATVLEPKTLLRVCPLALALACVIFLIGASGQSMIYSVVLQTGYAGREPSEGHAPRTTAL